VTWWAWVLVWTAAALGAVTVMFRLARSLWRKSVALFTALGDAADRLGAVDERDANPEDERAIPGGHTDAAAAELAIFASPARLRQSRAQARSRRPRPAHPPRHRAVLVRPTEPDQGKRG
jgi:hypothetical protein